MSRPPAVYGLERIRGVMEPGAVGDVVRAALVSHASGRMITPPPGELLFDSPPGDCHVKFGRAQGGAAFVVKLATGFYGNPALGLPVNDGLVVLLSATTGSPLAIFLDEGWMTSWRTAAAGTLALEAGVPSAVTSLGVVGTGHQAELQALWGARALGDPPVVVWGRSAEKAGRLVGRLLAEGIRATAAATLDSLMERCNVIVSATASNAPLFHASNVRAGTHLVSLGTDSTRKSECDPTLFERATRVATDDRSQCLAFGDFGTAVRAGMIGECADIALGSVLAGAQALRERAEDITLVTLTGVAAQDLAIATLFHERLQAQPVGA